MADYFDTFWDAFEPVLQTAWSDATALWRATQSRRINPRELIEQTALAAPFAAVQIGAALPGEFGVTNRVHVVPVACYYVHKDKLLNASEVTAHRIVERKLEAKCKTLVDTLLDYSGTAFQVMEEPSVDCGDNNPANAVFIQDGKNLIAGMVMFNAVIGETQ